MTDVFYFLGDGKSHSFIPGFSFATDKEICALVDGRKVDFTVSPHGEVILSSIPLTGQKGILFKEREVWDIVFNLVLLQVKDKATLNDVFKVSRDRDGVISLGGRCLSDVGIPVADGDVATVGWLKVNIKEQYDALISSKKDTEKANEAAKMLLTDTLEQISSLKTSFKSEVDAAKDNLERTMNMTLADTKIKQSMFIEETQSNYKKAESLLQQLTDQEKLLNKRFFEFQNLKKEVEKLTAIKNDLSYTISGLVKKGERLKEILNKPITCMFRG